MIGTNKEIYTRVYTPWGQVDLYTIALDWLEATNGPDRISVWGTVGSWVNGQRYYSGLVFYELEDMVAFKLKFPELIVSIEK